MEPNKIKVKTMAVIMRGNEVLVTLGRDDVKGEDFGRLIGGGVEFGETSEQALRRELKEELNAEIKEIKFIDVIENIFTYVGLPGHQITFLYKVELADKEIYKKEKIPIIDKPDFVASWISLADEASGKIKIYPESKYWDKKA